MVRYLMPSGNRTSVSTSTDLLERVKSTLKDRTPYSEYSNAQVVEDGLRAYLDFLRGKLAPLNSPLTASVAKTWIVEVLLEDLKGVPEDRIAAVAGRIAETLCTPDTPEAKFIAENMERLQEVIDQVLKRVGHTDLFDLLPLADPPEEVDSKAQQKSAERLEQARERVAEVFPRDPNWVD